MLSKHYKKNGGGKISQRNCSFGVNTRFVRLGFLPASRVLHGFHGFERFLDTHRFT